MTSTGAAPSRGLHLSRSRGAPDWRLRIYDALWEADQEGRTLTFQELVDECIVRFNKSGTMQWWEGYCTKRGTEKVNKTYRDIVRDKTQRTLRMMSTAGEAINDGPNKTPAWRPGKPPRYWHRKTYRPGYLKDYLPARADPEARKAARRMDSGWFAEVRMELAKPKPRGDRMKELLSEGLDIFGA